MCITRKQSNFIVLNFVLVALLGFALPGITMADPGCSGTKVANVVALDRAIFFNRSGAFSPGGMIYALRRDVIDVNTGKTEAEYGVLTAGQVNLRPDKRPRPLVLRMNEGDCLTIHFQNLLNAAPFLVDVDNVPLGNFPGPEDVDQNGDGNLDGAPSFGEQPVTRSAGIHASGLQLVNSIHDDGTNVGTNNSVPGPGNPEGLSGLVQPGGSITYTLYAQLGAEGIYVFTSTPVISGEGDGASVAMGLFGTINVEPPRAEYYRSQLTRQEMDWATTGYYSTDHPIIDYDAVYPEFPDVDNYPFGNFPGTEDDDQNGNGNLDLAAGPGKVGLPIIKMTDAYNNIVHGDLRAIITGPGRGNFAGGTYPPNPVIAPNDKAVHGGVLHRQAPGAKKNRPREEPFREFSAIFHDEVFAVQAYPEIDEDEVLSHTLHCCRDAFAINYGIGGIAAEVLANRKGQGPQWDCVDCKYEEFFLTSWALGDPALNVDLPANMSAPRAPGGPEIATKALWPDDPSNVEHSYIGDHVKIRNVHAGPKEHHIFHLHSHQWVFTPDDDESVYLDSQAIGPGSSYNYEITYNGSGNRNQTPGDAIYHCHFYPHFAQGMWALWRNHDVFEQGTLMNGDGTVQAGARALPDGEIVAGTPIPALVPIPTLAMAPMPGPVTVVAKDYNDLPDGSGIPGNFLSPRQIGSNVDVSAITDFMDPTQNPGYPFIIGGESGHRPPHPILDHAVIGGVIQDGGLHDPANANNSRHVVVGGLVGEVHTNRLDMRKFSAELEVRWLPEDGNAVEKLGTLYHSLRTHASITPGGYPLNYVTNGLPPVHGAPFADPCIDDQGKSVGGAGAGSYDNVTPAQNYKAADIQIDMVFNKLGEHYPQARIIALWDDVAGFIAGTKAPEPLFFRANSRDCIEYWQTNLTPEEFELDDFQVRTPTDVIGQHIHLVKFDVTSSDGSANGWNFEDGSFAPGEVVERIEAINTWNDAHAPTTHLAAVEHPFFGGYPGAETVIQRWYADETMSMTGMDRTLRTVYTHDHFAPSTHQQAGLYAGLLIEPEGSEWRDSENGDVMGGRTFTVNGETLTDGGPTSWKADILTSNVEDSYREFMFEFADFALGYEPGVLGQAKDDAGIEDLPQPNFVNRALAINPPAKETVGLPFVLLKAEQCPGGVAPPCPEGVSADDPGSFVVNYRNESVLHRILNPNPVTGADCRNPSDFFELDGVTPLPAAIRPSGCQAPGLAGDLAHVFRSDLWRANPLLNSVGPVEADGTQVYPALTAGLHPGDPFTPMMRTFEDDKVQLRFMVGAHEEGHVETVYGVKWLFEPGVEDSGWRNGQMAGISEHFEFEIQNLADVKGGGNFEDRLYNFDTSSDGVSNGVWGILRSYAGPSALKAEGIEDTLQPLPNNLTGKTPGGNQLANKRDFRGVCPTDAPSRKYGVQVWRAKDILPAGTLVYNSRAGAFNGKHPGPLNDPYALMYVLKSDIKKSTGKLKAGAPVEPLVLRAAAGECIYITLENKLPDQELDDPDAFNIVPMIREKFNLNEIQVSNHVGLHPQMVAYDIAKDEGANIGFNTAIWGERTARPGGVVKYKWYAGDVRIVENTGGGKPFKLQATPIEFGATNLVPADPLEHSAKGLIASLIIEPEGATWITDPGSHASATVYYTDENDDEQYFREFVLNFQDDIQLRDANGDPICPVAGAGEAHGGPSTAEFVCSGPEDPEDSGNKAVNYKTEPAWFRKGHDPGAPFGVTRQIDFTDLLANNVVPEGGGAPLNQDPQTPIFTAHAGDPVRMRILQSGGHPRNHVFALHGHIWQKTPHVATRSDDYGSGNPESSIGSERIGDNPKSEHYGTQAGHGPQNHFDVVLENGAGGYFGVTGDYLWRNQSSFQFDAGHWGLLRVLPKP